MRGARQRHGRRILAFALATSHLFITGGSVHAGVENSLDRFDAQSYSNSDGSRSWTGPWEEVGESTDPLGGDWQVVEDPGFGQFALGKKGAAGLGIQRQADLDGFSSATLEFDYRRNFLPSGKAVDVQLSSTGTAGPWTTVHTIFGVSPPMIDPAYIPVSLDLSVFISSETAIRFLHPSSSSSFGTPMSLYIDNVEIVGDLTNGAPVLSVIGTLSGDEGSLIETTATATDPDIGDALTFSLGGTVPQGASITTDGVFNWTPTETQGPGTYSFEVVVTDDGTPALSDSETITVNVHEVSSPPVVTDPGNQADGEGDFVTLVVSASDSDVPASTLTWSATGLPPGLSINSATGEISGVIDHAATAASPYSVQVTVSDGTEDGNATFQWVVTNTNRAPVLSPIGNVSGDEGASIGFTATAADPDPGVLSFSMGGAVPQGASITTGGEFSWIPSESQGPGTYSFDVVVTDDGTPTLSDTETVTLTVREVNSPPIVTSPADQLSGEGESVSLMVVATDSDAPASALTWSAIGLPPGLSINTSTGRISGVVSYSAAKGTSYATQVTASDGQLDNTAVFAWTVTNGNQAPALSGIGDLSGDEGTPIGYTASAVDPDPGDVLTFFLDGAPGGASMTSGGVFTWTPTETQGPGVYTFDVVVTDNGTPALSDAETITVMVNEVNIAPVAMEDRYTVTQGGTLAIGSTGVLTNDSDADHHDLSAWVVDGPDRGTLELDADGSFVYANTGETDNDDSFIYRISDGSGGHATAIVTIVVEPRPNRAPIAASDRVQLEEDIVVSIDALANDSDPDGDELIVTSVVLARGGEISLEGARILRFSPTRDFYGTVRASYTVEDDQGASTTAEVLIEVTPVNDRPHAIADDLVLGQYLSQHIPVLANDSDPDGDVLKLASVADPDRGQVEISGDEVLYTAPKGWTGTTSFTYLVEDGSGGTSVGVVTVEVPRATLVAARQLSNVLGTDQLKSQWVDSLFESKVDLALSPLMGLQLFVQAFFQSLDGIELSLALLGMTAVVLTGFSLVSRLPLVVPIGSPRYWSAVLIGRESQLEVHEKPNRTSGIIYQLRPATKGIESEPARRLMPRGWIPVETPRGQGWAETDQLTEQVDAQSFAEDDRPSGMVDQLANRLSRGKDITRLVGRRGLIVDVGNGLEALAPEALSGLLRGGPRWARQSQLEVELESRVVTPFLEAYEASDEISADSSHSSSVLLPTEILNFRYLTVGDPGVGTWLVLFEYEKGRPRIVGILRDE